MQTFGIGLGRFDDEVLDCATGGGARATPQTGASNGLFSANDARSALAVAGLVGELTGLTAPEYVEEDGPYEVIETDDGYGPEDDGLDGGYEVVDEVY